MGTEVLSPSPHLGFAHDAIDLGQSAIKVLSSSKMWQHVIVALSVAAIVAPFSYYSGLVFSRFLKLPQITGYLISGIVCGPYLLGILSKESVLDLNIVEGACLSVIGLAAGAELDWPQLSKSRKQVLGITIGVCAASWAFCYLAFDIIFLTFPLMPEMDARHLLATASLGATLMMTRSPASAIAVLKEVEGKGPFCSLVMAVVVVKDVIVIMAFALNIELIRAAILPAKAVGGTVSLLNLTLPALSVALSMSIGVCGGLLLGFVMNPRTSGMEAGTSRFKPFAVLGLSTTIFQISHYLDAEPLLACVTMGMVAVNRRHERMEKEKEELHGMLAQIMGLSNVAFFGLAGASLKLDALKDMFGAALLVCLVRLAAIYVGSWLGCYFTSTMTEFRKLFWMSMVTQAGVAMGLARLAGTRFPDWGAHFQTFMMSIILINLLIGPPLFRLALVKIGETKASGPLIMHVGPGSSRRDSSGGGPTATGDNKTEDSVEHTS
ncbi:hypothetical protein CEUSTIGMA_g6349.t1 [Chlamydomonas eustigma]|uniref:Cation/H+ exchanger transmembrane domain-containing protein n=1 Tax=Chlamydomonas eustigma TaxID=1157962 RepID=A0A250X817_9CHLO|nr:hypothetical protein CEUSTIGMA_g6349.t1 [Chlamydomonas eustigma]|eukprot:GAX78910.1 hypothetical protein CEUSTIGMA_g6349.t1 [Chlamydomonas eustigma]